MKNRKIIIVVRILIAMIIVGVLASLPSKEDTTIPLVIKKDNITFEYGEKLPDEIAGYKEVLDYSKVPDDEIENIQISIDVKNATITTTNEDGSQSEIEADYPEVGEYPIAFLYDHTVATTDVIIVDTTKPKLTVPKNIKIVQGTDLSIFDFKSLF